VLLVVDSVAPLHSSRVDIVRVKSVGSLVVVIDGGCSFYEHLYDGSRHFIVESRHGVKQGSCSDD
jgi:hypothetical protein